jgi:hypothetical protein
MCKEGDDDDDFKGGRHSAGCRVGSSFDPVCNDNWVDGREATRVGAKAETVLLQAHTQ